MKTEYVCGFLMTWDMDRILFIDKGSKTGELGIPLRLVPLGGKIEEINLGKGPQKETPHEAMVREFLEESGSIIKAQRWHCFFVKEYQTVKIYFFVSFCSPREMHEVLHNNINKRKKTSLGVFLYIHSYVDVLFDEEKFTYDIPYLIQMIIRESRSGFLMKLDPEGINSARLPPQII